MAGTPLVTSVVSEATLEPVRLVMEGLGVSGIEL